MNDYDQFYTFETRYIQVFGIILEYLLNVFHILQRWNQIIKKGKLQPHIPLPKIILREYVS